MKTKILYRVTMITAMAGIIYACNKSNTSTSNTSGQSTANLQTQSDDQARVGNESDAVANDVNVTLASPGADGTTGAGFHSGVKTAGATPINSLICDATVTLDSVARIITITYNGSNCSGTRTRTGTVVITLPATKRWSDTGAVITVNIQNLKITRLSDNKSITLNGTHIYTNVTGGRLADLPTRGTIVHTIVGDSMSITFDDGSQRKWNFARKRTFSFNNGAPTITIAGMHSDGTNSGVSEWGTTRFGNAFETIITQPLIFSYACNFRLTTGAEAIIRPDITVNITFGLDATGKPTTCPGAGASYYFQATWVATGGKSGSVIWPY